MKKVILSRKGVDSVNGGFKASPIGQEFVLEGEKAYKWVIGLIKNNSKNCNKR